MPTWCMGNELLMLLAKVSPDNSSAQLRSDSLIQTWYGGIWCHLSTFVRYEVRRFKRAREPAECEGNSKILYHLNQFGRPLSPALWMWPKSDACPLFRVHMLVLVGGPVPPECPKWCRCPIWWPKFGHVSWVPQLVAGDKISANMSPVPPWPNWFKWSSNLFLYLLARWLGMVLQQAPLLHNNGKSTWSYGTLSTFLNFLLDCLQVLLLDTLQPLLGLKEFFFDRW
jgi:hypothetical protein